jgi:hypothetical protein
MNHVVRVILEQLSQSSTIVSLINAVILIAGYKIAPEKIESIGLILSFIDTIVLAVVQEKRRDENASIINN